MRQLKKAQCVPHPFQPERSTSSGSKGSCTTLKACSSEREENFHTQPSQKVRIPKDTRATAVSMKSMSVYKKHAAWRCRELLIDQPASYTHTCTHTHTHPHACTHTCTHTHPHACTHTHVHTHTRMYTHMYTHTHTHTHTHKGARTCACTAYEFAASCCRRASGAKRPPMRCMRPGPAMCGSCGRCTAPWEKRGVCVCECVVLCLCV